MAVLLNLEGKTEKPEKPEEIAAEEVEEEEEEKPPTEEQVGPPCLLSPFTLRIKKFFIFNAR